MSRTPNNHSAALWIGLTLLTFGLIALFAASSHLWKIKTVPNEPKHRTKQGVRLDPWRPLPGCVTLQGRQGEPVLWAVDAATRAACGKRFKTLPTDMPGMGIKDNELGTVLRAIGQWRAPLAPSETQPMNWPSTSGTRTPQGAHVQLTLDAVDQPLAGRLIACLTGRHAECAAIGIDSDTWKHQYESAAMRAGSLLVMDIATGDIEVAASAYTPCFAAEQSGQPLPAECPPSSREAVERKWKLDNGALFASEMPGSLAKLPLLLALLRDPVIGLQIRREGAFQRSFLNDIQKSETTHFLDRVFCQDTNFQNCDRLPRVVTAAHDLGWNAPSINMTGMPGTTVDTKLNAHSGRLLQDIDRQSSQWKPMSLAYKPEAARRCAEQPEPFAWSKCRNEAVANLAAEVWGQGNARTSPVAVAAMLGRLAAAANGQAMSPPPHLVHSLQGEISNRPQVVMHRSQVPTSAISAADATMILQGMALTHQPGGTAYTACLSAFGNTPEGIKQCASLGGMAGKTGTPVFNHDRLRVGERSAHCADIRASLSGGAVPKTSSKLRNENAQCQMSPLKWYAAVIRDDPRSSSGPWRKVVVALAERNWRLDGHVDAADDRGTNMAAEMVFRFIALQGENHDASR